MPDYDIIIEIDADTGAITWGRGQADGEMKKHNYTVEELEGKNIISNLMGGVSESQITVYSQELTISKEEYIRRMGL